MPVSLNFSMKMTRFLLVLMDLYNITIGRFRKSGKTQPPYPELVGLLEGFNNTVPAPDILFFGDSVLLRVSRDDTDTDTLDQMLSKKLGGKLKLLSIAHTAYHMQIYKSLIRVLDVTKRKPRVVILPINLRSFSPQWDFYPAWQFHDEIQAVENYLSNPSLEIAGVNEVSATSNLLRLFDAIPVKYPLTELNRIGQFRSMIASKSKNEDQKNSRLRQIFIYHYMHPLSEDHPKIKALEECVRMLSVLKIPLVLYVTPINWEAGRKYVGWEFIEAVKSNVNTISNRLSPHQMDNKVNFADLSILLEAGCFFSDDNATEHLNQQGRRLLADEIMKMILELNLDHNTEVI
ncbi:MAG: hypothetical protein KJZ72_00540 [Anaerolineales bacterium]|nr:hypothetical protein [Anaerolineales bacterium]